MCIYCVTKNPLFRTIHGRDCDSPAFPRMPAASLALTTDQFAPHVRVCTLDLRGPPLSVFDPSFFPLSSFIERKMISVEDKAFNSLMGTLEVPYRYHKTLHSAGRRQTTPSANLDDWLPIENAENVWRQVRSLLNVGNRQNNSVDRHQRSVLAGSGLPVSNTHAQTTSEYEPTPLPDDHPTHMLEESRRYYQDLPEGETIPFLVSKRKPEKIRTVVLATDDGKRPDVPVKVQIYLREWDTRFAFWTMDINNKRIIVKNMSGAPNGGSRYNYWAGPNRGLKGPIAFSDNSATGSSRKAPYTDYVELDSDADDIQQEEITDGTRSGQYFKEANEFQNLSTPLQAESTKSNTSEEDPDSIIPYPFPNDEEESQIQAKQVGHPASAKATSPGQPASTKVTSSSAGHPSYGSGLATLPEAVAVKRRKTDTLSNPFDGFDRDPSGLNVRSKSTLTARRSRSIPTEETAQAPRPRVARKSLASGSSGTPPPRWTPQLMSTLTARPSKSSQPEEVVQVPRPLIAQENLFSDPPISIPQALSPEKQENTWLQVRLEPHGFNRVKKFRSCFTVSQLFTLVANARNIPVADLERAEVTIDGADDNQKAFKIELMPSDDEEYMEALTDRIDAWPLEKGRCTVDVVLYRHGQVSIAVNFVENPLTCPQTSEPSYISLSSRIFEARR